MKKFLVWIQNKLGYGYCRYDIDNTVIHYKGELPRIWDTLVPVSILLYLRRIERLYDRKIVAIHMSNSEVISNIYNLPYKLVRAEPLKSVHITNSTAYQVSERGLINECMTFFICNDVLERSLGKITDALFFNLEFKNNAEN